MNFKSQTTNIQWKDLDQFLCSTSSIMRSSDKLFWPISHAMYYAIDQNEGSLYYYYIQLYNYIFLLNQEDVSKDAILLACGLHSFASPICNNFVSNKYMSCNSKIHIFNYRERTSQ